MSGALDATAAVCGGNIVFVVIEWATVVVATGLRSRTRPRAF